MKEFFSWRQRGSPSAKRGRWMKLLLGDGFCRQLAALGSAGPWGKRDALENRRRNMTQSCFAPCSSVFFCFSSHSPIQTWNVSKQEAVGCVTEFYLCWSEYKFYLIPSCAQQTFMEHQALRTGASVSAIEKSLVSWGSEKELLRDFWRSDV